MTRGRRVAVCGFLISAILFGVLVAFALQPNRWEQLVLSEREGVYVNFPALVRWGVVLLFVLNAPVVLLDRAFVWLIARFISMTPGQELGTGLAFFLPVSAVWWMLISVAIGRKARRRA